MTQPLRIALAGLGTVGGGVVRLLDALTATLIARRAGRPIEVVAVSARDRSKDRGFDIGALPVGRRSPPSSPVAAADVVVELVGGSDGPALALARTPRWRRARASSPPTRR